MTEPIKQIFWHQGLFLQPQHFQWQERGNQYRLYPQQTYMQPYFWGFGRLRIQEDSLKNMMFEIRECEALFRDGTWVAFPGNSELPPRSFKGVWTEDMAQRFRVYLGLRKLNPDGENVTVAGRDEEPFPTATRFVSPADPEEIKDIYKNGPVAQIKLLSHALRIFWETEIESAGEYELLPLAQLEFDGNEIVLSRTYVPPFLSIAGADILAETLKSIREEVTLRGRVLEEYKHPQLARTIEIAASVEEANYLTFLLALHSLSRYIPILHHLTDNVHIHPWAVYGLLRGLVGELSTFSDRTDILGRLKDGSELVPPYRHDNIGACYAEIRMLINELLNSIMIGAKNIIHLVREEDYFQAAISPETFDNRNLFYLVLRSGADPDEWAGKAPHLIKISSAERLPVLIRRALPGMPLERTTILPPGLPRRSDSIYFKLDRSGAEWAEIQKQQNICLYWSNAPEDTSADIIVIRK